MSQESNVMFPKL